MIYRFADCELNTQLVELRRNGKPVALEPQVYRLLQLLIENHQQVLSKDQILATIWQNRVVSDASLSSCIKAIRQAIGDTGDKQQLVKTVRGHGFRFIAELQSNDRVQTASANTELVKPPSANESTPVWLRSKKAFAGRALELQKITPLLAQLSEFNGHVALLAGSAGIGKSRLLEEIAVIAHGKQIQVMWGRCREDTGAPAYWPWKQLLCANFRDQQFVTANEHPELAHLIPQLFQPQAVASLENIESEGSGSEQTRFKLFHGICSLLSCAAASQPMLIILDDLHRADLLSLQLLELLATELEGQGIMIIGSYRDSDVSDDHRFSKTISELSRLYRYSHLHLSNLDVDAVTAFIQTEITDVTANTLSRIVQRTDGHPLYLMETIRHLQQGGDAEALPQNLKAIINQRLMSLCDETLKALRAAAVIGRSFDILTLHNMLGIGVEVVLQRLESALVSGQLNELNEPGQFQFSHALIRDTLYDALTSAERLHLHCNLAEYLEHSSSDLVQIAFHYHQASPLGMADKAVEYAYKAGVEANKMMAYEIAVRYFQQALRLAPLSDKPKLTLTLAMAQLRSGESVLAIVTFEKACELAEQSCENLIFAEAAMGMEDASWRPGLANATVLSFLQRALEYPQINGSKLEVRLLCALIRGHMMCGDRSVKTKKLQQKARQLAEIIGDDELMARVLLAEILATQLDPLIPSLYELRIGKGEEAVELAMRSGNVMFSVEIYSWLIQDLFVVGNIDRMLQHIDRQLQLGERIKQPYFNYYFLLWHSLLNFAQGNFSAAQQFADKALDHCRWLPGQDGDGIYGIQTFSIKRELGQLQGFAPIVEQFVKSTSKQAMWKPGLALIYADIGEVHKAQTLLDELLREEQINIPNDAMWLTSVAYLSEVCATLGATQYAQRLYDLLLPHQDFNLLIGSNISTLGAVSRILGMLATALQQWSIAEAHFEHAIASNDKQSFAVFSAHSRYAYACMLHTRNIDDDVNHAQTLVDETLVLAQQHNLKALSEKTLTLRQRLRSGPVKAASHIGELSKREIEVLKLVASGKSNRQIGEVLFVSPNTVAAHIRNILEKTATCNRAEVTAYAAQNNLLN
ncbi:AAA family ATPase [Alteromonadaceae bacterium BrNp21-10]|nr:AAA family ATPase [Alteromonadaceae bacterium BrNp21-10]